jgi:hypothetical protein
MHILKENDLWVVSKIEYQDEDIAWDTHAINAIK